LADIFEEVEEGIRQDRMTKLWKKYSVVAYIAAAALLGGVALNEYLQASKASAIEKDTLAYEAALDALDAGEYEVAASGFQALIDADTQSASAAAHMLAQVRLAGNGDVDAAAAALKQVIDSGDTATAKLALLKTAYLKADTATRAELEDLLADIRKDESAFSALAVELIAAKAMQEGDLDYARTEFTYLGLAPNAPSGVRTRAEKALATLPPRAIETPETETATGEETGQ
jgi:hypothetical protein